jgi:glutamate N-acetyltransferase/amino-acid N-acetyltransferase
MSTDTVTHERGLIDFPSLATHYARGLPELSARLHEVDPTEEIAGFSFGGVYSGIKKSAAHLDFGLIITEDGATCAGVYTQNLVVAAPVTLSRAHLARSPQVLGVVVNSGNANACTGEQGDRDAQHTCQLVARSLSSLNHRDIEPHEIQVASTGVIGAPLPVKCLEDSLEALVTSCDPSGLERFATAMMTTDNRPKARAAILDLIGVEGAEGVSKVRFGGCSKGAGMIHPNMATMLAYLCTDAPVDESTLSDVWRRVCDQSFNAITIDGDTSTNDTALCLASGRAARIHDQSGFLHGAALRLFEEALLTLAQALAVDILRDGEGVEHVAALTITGARTQQEARQIAETVALSPLVKTAMNGCDPNWGRIIAAVGRSKIEVDPNSISLAIGGHQIFERGVWLGVEGELRAHEIMKGAEYDIEVDLGLGEVSFTLFMSDLSAQYVRINADYRS